MSRPSSLWPETSKPKLLSKTEADKIAKDLNGDGKLKITFGVQPSSVHWHVKHISETDRYITGRIPERAIQDLLASLEQGDND